MCFFLNLAHPSHRFFDFFLNLFYRNLQLLLDLAQGSHRFLYFFLNYFQRFLNFFLDFLLMWLDGFNCFLNFSESPVLHSIPHGYSRFLHWLYHFFSFWDNFRFHLFSDFLDFRGQNFLIITKPQNFQSFFCKASNQAPSFCSKFKIFNEFIQNYKKSIFQKRSKCFQNAKKFSQKISHCRKLFTKNFP